MRPRSSGRSFFSAIVWASGLRKGRARQNRPLTERLTPRNGGAEFGAMANRLSDRGIMIPDQYVLILRAASSGTFSADNHLKSKGKHSSRRVIMAVAKRRTTSQPKSRSRAKPGARGGGAFFHIEVRPR